MKKYIFVFIGFLLVCSSAKAEYSASLINRLEQYGTVSYDLIVEDTERIKPSIRVPKNYRSGISQEEIDNDIQETITMFYDTPPTEQI